MTQTQGTPSFRRLHRALGLTLAGFMALAGGAATAQNLVVNGGFTQFVAPTQLNPATGLPYTSFYTRPNTPEYNQYGYGYLTGWVQSNSGGGLGGFNGSTGQIFNSNDNDTMYMTAASANSPNCCYTLWSYANNHVYNNPPANSWDGRGPNGANFFVTDPVYNPATLSQSVTLQAGQQYTLNFDWAEGQATVNSGANAGGWKVLIGNQTTNTATYTNTSQGFSGWMNYSYTFTAATSGPVTLSFIPTGTGVPPMDLLANVSLTAVPEPTTMLMFGLGLAGVMVVRRRTRQ